MFDNIFGKKKSDNSDSNDKSVINQQKNDNKLSYMTTHDNTVEKKPEYIPPYRVRKSHNRKYIYYDKQFSNVPYDWSAFKDFADKYKDGSYQVLNKKGQLVKTIKYHVPIAQNLRIERFKEENKSLQEQVKNLLRELENIKTQRSNELSKRSMDIKETLLLAINNINIGDQEKAKKLLLDLSYSIALR